MTEKRTKKAKSVADPTQDDPTQWTKKFELSQEEVDALAEVEIVCDEKAYLTEKKFNFGWLQSLAERYGFDKFEYLHKFRAFRCYRQNKHLDWIDINNLSLINGGRRLEEIRLKHQVVSPTRAVIQYPWR
jgi:hypothetical protein|tara:strand:+ start:1046 stop:1435 length:390 start_codon:yes stop_codon:yes gene_type:complete